MEFPILNKLCRLAGWSKEPPRYQGAELRHEEAEELIGRPIVIMPVKVVAEDHARRCGGNYHDVEGGWCLAIAPSSCIPQMPITIREEAAA